MDRLEQITKAANDEYPKYSPGYVLAFKEGAKWADLNPDIHLVKAEVVRGKNQQIDLLSEEVEKLKETIRLILIQRENFSDDAANNIYKLATEALQVREGVEPK